MKNKKLPDLQQVHTLLSQAHSHIHGDTTPYISLTGLRKGRVGMWTRLNIDEPAAIDTLTNGGQKEEGFVLVLLKSILRLR